MKKESNKKMVGKKIAMTLKHFRKLGVWAFTFHTYVLAMAAGSVAAQEHTNNKSNSSRRHCQRTPAATAPRTGVYFVLSAMCVRDIVARDADVRALRSTANTRLSMAEERHSAAHPHSCRVSYNAVFGAFPRCAVFDLYVGFGCRWFCFDGNRFNRKESQ